MNKDRLEMFILRYQDAMKNGCSAYQVIASMKDDNLQILDAIKIVRKICGLPLKEAKIIVSSHPSWSTVTERSQALQDDFERVFSKTKK
jgi:ribosomal protein L7/L12